MKLILFSILLLVIASSVSSQEIIDDNKLTNTMNSTVIAVNHLSVWIVNHVFKVQAFADMMLNILNSSIQNTQVKNMIESLNSVLKTVGFIVIFLICSLILLAVIILIGFLQCCCNTCSVPNYQYGAGHKFSSKALIVCVLFASILLCICGIYFYVNLSNSGAEITNIISQVENTFEHILNDIGKDVIAVNNLNVTSVTLPKFFSIMNESVTDYETSSRSDLFKQFTSTGYWIPIIIFVVIILFSIGGIIIGFLEKRTTLAIITAFFFLIYFIVLIFSISSGTSALIFSDICVGGVDTHITTVVESLGNKNDTCISESLKNYFFCQPINITKCQAFSNITTWLEETIANLTLYENKTIEVNKTITLLEDLLKDVNKLIQCNATQVAYQNLITTACGPFTTYLMESFLMMEILSGLSFLFLMTFFYSLHRLGVNIPKDEIPYTRLSTRVNDSEISMRSGRDNLPKPTRTTSTRTPSKYYSTNYGGAPMSRTESKECASVGCFIYTLIIFGLWGAIVFSAGFAVFFGSSTEDIKRTAV